MPEIFVDNRESSKFYRLGYKLYPKYSYHYVKLNTFDVIIGNEGQIGIEIKRKGDLPSSLVDKRYKNQLKKMAEFREQHGTHCYYMIQGTYLDLIKTERYPWLTKKIYYGILASISENADMKIIPVDNDEMIWTAIDRLIYKYNNKTPLKHVDVIPNGSTIQEKMLKCIPGISDVHAKAILEVFTLNDLIEIDEKELLEVGGIGPKRASSIISAFQGSECFD
jgi:ERCC4-type nuclease